MRRLVVSEFASLDGVMQDPGGAEGFDRGGWAFRSDRGPEGDAFKLDEVMQSDTLLLGRVTYEGFAAAWPGITDEEGFAAQMNGMAKLVVSTTLAEATWNNSSVIRSDIVEQVRTRKQAPGKGILVAGSLTLARTLLAAGLVDELRLMVFPILLGTGKRLFDGADEPVGLTLIDSKTVGAGIVILTYEPVASTSP